MKINKYTDQTTLVPTKTFPYGTFPFEEFNVVQSRVNEFYQSPDNALIAASTSAGKTTVAEMFLSHEVRERKGKGMFLAPMKSLAQEKIDEWTDPNHHFHDLKLSICTGDYRLTSDRKKELEDCDLILMTSEMLNSKSRNHRSENNSYIEAVKTLVIDEVHLLGTKSRGDKLEAGIMKFVEINPDARIVCLSATLPNVDQIAEWISHITKRDTNVIISNHRPCKLFTWYEYYDDTARNYDAQEQEKVSEALRIVKENPDDKFIVFAHGKRTAESMVKALKSTRIDCDYHCADLDKEKRIKIESDFKNTNKFRVLVATSTLATGCNLPARRVIVLGVHRGMTEVETSEIMQACGRAGRPKYDKRGDAYILVPYNDAKNQITRLSKPEPIISQMMDHKVLSFHIVSEIHHGNVKTVDDIFTWYNRTLASFQAKDLEQDIVETVVKNLRFCGAIYEEDDILKITPIGKVASLFYYSPFDIADLKHNFDVLFENGKQRDDLWISMCLGNVSSNYNQIVNKNERLEMNSYTMSVLKNSIKGKLAPKNTGTFNEGVIKASFCYENLLTGKTNPAFMSLARIMQFDFQRVVEVLHAIDSMAAKWGEKNYFNEVATRMRYGVSWDMVELVKIKDIGAVKAKRLWNFNLRTVDEVADNPHLVAIALGCTDAKAKQVSENAKEILNG